MDRRRFLLSSTTAALAACSAPPRTFGPLTGAQAPAASTMLTGKPLLRLEVSEFSQDAQLVAAFRTGIAAMRKIANPENNRSYDYWHNSHWMASGRPPRAMETVWDQCRHGVSYFFAWHRGFLIYFERRIREASGNPNFTLPYWDYYRNPKIPTIFAEPLLEDGSPNPLYWPDRTGKVITGLSYAPFAPSVTTFPFGPGDTFEDLVERNPHGHVHDQVGGSMGSVPTAPADPIFWVHHSNIDRYWSAWLAAGGGRRMPDPERLWWQQQFFYDVGRNWRATVRQMNATRNFGYGYSDLSLPVAPSDAVLPVRPAVVAVGAANAGGPIALHLEPVTIEVPIAAELLRSPALALTLDGVTLSGAGLAGGYDFAVYANLPTRAAELARERAFSLGSFGPFELTMPQKAGMAMPSGRALRFGLAEALRRQAELGLAPGPVLRISFVPFGQPSGVGRNTELVRIARIGIAG